MTVSIQSDLRVLNAGISHGVILMMEIMKRKSGKNETGRGGDHDNRECSPASTAPSGTLSIRVLPVREWRSGFEDDRQQGSGNVSGELHKNRK
jgi:hypothetical protein